MALEQTGPNTPDGAHGGALPLQELITRGLALKNENRFSEAIDALSLAVSALQSKMGDCLAEEGRHDEALALYCRILADQPAQPDALIGAGVVSLLREDQRGALFYFHRALEVDGRGSKANCGYGMALAMAGDAEASRAYFREALAGDPENLSAIHGLVRSAYSLCLFSETAEYVADYLRYHPGDPDMLFTLAGLRYKEGKPEEAAECLDRLLTLSPSYPGGNELLDEVRRPDPARQGQTGGGPAAGRVTPAGAFAAEGRRLKTESNFHEALAAFGSARELGDGTVTSEMADCCANLGQTERAALLYREALLVNPEDVRALIGQGVLSLLAGNAGEAAASFHRALRAQPGEPRALSGLGMAKNLHGDREGAFDCFAGALDADPEDLSSLHELVKGAYLLGRFADAERHLESYLLYHPGDLDMIYSLAGVRFKAGKLAQARDDIEKVLLLSPGYEGGMELHGKIHQRLCA